MHFEEKGTAIRCHCVHVKLSRIMPVADASSPLALASVVIDTKIVSPEADKTNASVPVSGLWDCTDLDLNKPK